MVFTWARGRLSVLAGDLHVKLAFQVVDQRRGGNLELRADLARAPRGVDRDVIHVKAKGYRPNLKLSRNPTIGL